jgi:hypothetical protein
MLNQALGLEMIYLPISMVSESKCFIDFVSSIICDAFRFADIYNQAILNQRQVFYLKPNQTLRSLKIDFQDKVVEIPFWLVYPSGKRLSLCVRLNGKNISFGSGFDVLGTFDKGNMRQFIDLIETHNCRIRPKAVGLTLFSRLYLADWFIHGVGGGKYEYLTDYILREYYGISNLNFGIAAATMPWLSDKLKTTKQISNYRKFFFGLFHEQRLKNFVNLREVENE